MTVSRIALAVGGRIDGADPDAVVRSIAIDSRAVGPGALFVALPGEQVDGHAFIETAASAGAVAALARTDTAAAGPLIRVADPGAALLSLGGAIRDRLPCVVVAITGSSGKTTTRDMIAAGCATGAVVTASEANQNNEIGVPLTIARADATTEIMVAEVGSRGIGHIAALMPILRPHVAVVTNVGPAHVGEFGSMENIAVAKAELVEALEETGTAVLNADDPVVRAMAGRTKARVVLFGRAEDADVRAVDISLDDDARASFTLRVGAHSIDMHLAIAGEHMVENALAAVAACRAAGVDAAAAARAIAACAAPRWRMQVEEVGSRRILNDAYNANPASMAASLKTLVAMGRGRTTWAVLGQMAELGDDSVAEHDRIGRLAVRLGVRRLLVVGHEAKAILEAARLEGMFDPEESFFAADPDGAVAILTERCEPDAIVLVKGSRAAGLEVVAEALGASA